MQVTKELIDNDIKASEANLEQAKASVNLITGALTVLRNIRAFLDQDEKPALSEDQLAEMVAGPGAKVEEITEISPENKVIQDKEAEAQAARLAWINRPRLKRSDAHKRRV